MRWPARRAARCCEYEARAAGLGGPRRDPAASGPRSTGRSARRSRACRSSVINIVAFSNYVLGWGHVQSDLDLQGATSLAATFKELLPADVDVRAAAAVVETCRGGEAWRVDRSAAARSCAARSPSASRRRRRARASRRRPRPARVLVVLPGPGQRSDAYVREVRRRLRRSAGAPVAVRVVKAPPWDDLVARTTAAAASWRPLAVLVAPPAGAPSATRPPTAPPTRCARLGTELRATGQPAVLSAPLPVETTATAPLPAGPPLAVRDRGAAAAASRSRRWPPRARRRPASREPPRREAQIARAARANVATLVRACWPGTLAPRLASTRLRLLVRGAGDARRSACRPRRIGGDAAGHWRCCARGAIRRESSRPAGWTPHAAGAQRVLPGRACAARHWRWPATSACGRPLVVHDETAPAALTLSLKR